MFQAVFAFGWFEFGDEDAQHIGQIFEEQVGIGLRVFGRELPCWLWVSAFELAKLMKNFIFLNFIVYSLFGATPFNCLFEHGCIWLLDENWVFLLQMKVECRETRIFFMTIALINFFNLYILLLCKLLRHLFPGLSFLFFFAYLY